MKLRLLSVVVVGVATVGVLGNRAFAQALDSATLVYRVAGDSDYHRADCPLLSGKVAVPQSIYLQGSGNRPCPVCKPQPRPPNPKSADQIHAWLGVRTADNPTLPPSRGAGVLAPGLVTVARIVLLAAFLLFAWGTGLLLLYVAGSTLSHITLRSIEFADCREAASRFELTLRSIYRKLVAVAAIYYYVSLPFVAVLVLVSAATLIYGFLLLEYVPVKLVLLLAIGAPVTVYKMVQSLFLRIPTGVEGRRLEETEAPGLFDLAREVAEKIGTRPIDEIRITPGTDFLVYERGSVRERASDEAHRVLVVGAGALTGLRRTAFRAVLAHEYGHFSHRDTAGGALALRVQQDMIKFAVAMVQKGQAVWWNLAFVFLRLYHFLFRRISHGATRLQEILADRLAAQNYGAAAFEEGLLHVVRRGVEFPLIARRELQSAVQMRRSCRNLYHLTALPGDGVEKLVQEVLNRPTSDDDTHPAPLYRFALVRGVTAPEQSRESGSVWDLFAEPERLQAEMTATVESKSREVHPVWA